jgi:hypothetical protein
MSTVAIDHVYRKAQDVKLRPLPEWSGGLVYTPRTPNLCYLNTTSWAVLQLAESRTLDAVLTAFSDLLDEPTVTEETREAVTEALTSLQEQHVLI